MARQKMLTAEIIKKTPGLYATEEVEMPNKKATARFFNPSGTGTWYMIEMDQKTGECFGMCHIHEWEAGYFSIKELESIRLRFGLYIERDIHFTPCKLSEIKELRHYLRVKVA